MQLPAQCRIGVVADTHLPDVADVLDELAALAPVVAARGNGDDGVDHPALRDAWVLRTPALTVGVVHEFPSPRHASADKLDRYRARLFGDHDPGVIVYGHTHHDELHHTGGRLYINPGSPTLPRNQTVRLGTLALLQLDGPHASVTVLQLTETGIEPAASLDNRN